MFFVLRKLASLLLVFLRLEGKSGNTVGAPCFVALCFPRRFTLALLVRPTGTGGAMQAGEYVPFPWAACLASPYTRPSFKLRGFQT